MFRDKNRNGIERVTNKTDNQEFISHVRALFKKQTTK